MIGFLRGVVGFAIGLVAGVMLTNVVLQNEAVRVWLINLDSLTVWLGTALIGALCATIAPRRFELPAGALSVLLGSVGGLLYFWSDMNFSLVNLGNLLTLGGSFLVSGFCLFIFAALGSWAVAGIRERIDENKESAGAGGQYPPRSYR